MEHTETEIKDMQKILKRMKPELETAAEVMANMIENISGDTVSVTLDVKGSFT